MSTTEEPTPAPEPAEEAPEETAPQTTFDPATGEQLPAEPEGEATEEEEESADE
jgi:hypothetical protein